MTFDDPTGEGRLTLAFDHVHDGVHATEGGRQVVCVDFKSADGTVYDVDFYVDRAGSTDTLVDSSINPIEAFQGRNSDISLALRMPALVCGRIPPSKAIRQARTR